MGEKSLWFLGTRPALPGLQVGLVLSASTYSQALLSQWVLKALQKPNSKWSTLYFANLRWVTWKNNLTIWQANYTSQDLLLLGVVSSFNKLLYMGGIWNAWLPLRGNLALSLESTLHLAHWLVADLIPFLRPFSFFSDLQIKGLLTTLAKLNIKMVEAIWNEERNSWRNFETTFDQIRGLHPWLPQLIVNFINTITLKKGITFNFSFDVSDWRWLDSEKTWLCLV